MRRRGRHAVRLILSPAERDRRDVSFGEFFATLALGVLVIAAGGALCLLIWA